MQAFVVDAQTKRFTKSAKGKAKSTVKQAAKTVKRNTPSPPKSIKQATKPARRAAGSKAGAENWYGPDRALFLGKALLIPYILVHSFILQLFLNLASLLGSFSAVSRSDLLPGSPNTILYNCVVPSSGYALCPSFKCR